jgi:hypothetical protein
MGRIHTMRKRTIVSCMLLAGSLVGIPAGGETPAAAQAWPGWTLVGGNFTGDARDETFWYHPGELPELLLSSSNGGVPDGEFDEVGWQFNVTRTYQPFAGDFDGDGYDEIFWYAPGTASDSIWHWRADSPLNPVSKPISVSGAYTPLVGDFNGDRIDDILWYAPGNAPDTMWYFRKGGSHVSVPRTINRSYRPVVASVGKDATDDILWYAPGTAGDTIWDFTRGTRNYTSKALTVNGSNYQPIGIDILGEGDRSEDVWWYAPGTAADPWWDYHLGAKVSAQNIPLSANRQIAVGDYFGDGQEDVYMNGATGGWIVRDFTTIDGQLVWIDHVSEEFTSSWPES